MTTVPSPAVERILNTVASSHISIAIVELAKAAACMERTSGKIGAEATWYVVRSLCAEHGKDYEAKVFYARSYAELQAKEDS